MDVDDKNSLMLQVAQLYYCDGLTQAAIADRIGSTRWTVGRLLENARTSGLVTITINHPLARQAILESRIAHALNVREAVVVPTAETRRATRDAVATAAVDFVEALRPRPRAIGMALGRTMCAIARTMPEHWTTGLTVCQLSGGLPKSCSAGLDPIGLMARKATGIGYAIPAPTIVGDPRLAAELREEPMIAATFKRASVADVVMYSPGAVDRSSSLVRSGYLNLDDMRGLKMLGAEADIISHFVGATGQSVSPELEARTIALDLSRLRQCRFSIAVALGEEKVPAILTAAKSGYCHVLVTDSDTAERLLASVRRENSQARLGEYWGASPADLSVERTG